MGVSKESSEIGTSVIVSTISKTEKQSYADRWVGEIFLRQTHFDRDMDAVRD